MGGMERIKGERSERKSDRAETHDHYRLNLGCFDVEKVRFFIKSALCLYSELCFLCRRGAHFQKNNEKQKWMENENGANIMSDTLKYNQNEVGYMKISPT